METINPIQPINPINPIQTFNPIQTINPIQIINPIQTINPIQILVKSSTIYLFSYSELLVLILQWFNFITNHLYHIQIISKSSIISRSLMVYIQIIHPCSNIVFYHFYCLKFLHLIYIIQPYGVATFSIIVLMFVAHQIYGNNAFNSVKIALENDVVA
eukprot:315625_1